MYPVCGSSGEKVKPASTIEWYISSVQLDANEVNKIAIKISSATDTQLSTRNTLQTVVGPLLYS